MHFGNGASEYTAVLHSKSKNYIRDIDISMIFRQEVEYFINMLKTNVMPYSYDQLIKPVAIMNGIMECISSGSKVEI